MTWFLIAMCIAIVVMSIYALGHAIGYHEGIRTWRGP